MYGKGGMKRLVNAPPPAVPISVTNANITIGDLLFGNIGEGSVRIITLDFENGTRINEVIDVNINEKRKRNDILNRRRVRFRADKTPMPSPPQPARPAQGQPMEDSIPIQPPPQQVQ